MGVHGGGQFQHAWPGVILSSSLRFKQVLRMPRLPRRHGTPTMAHLQLPELSFAVWILMQTLSVEVILFDAVSPLALDLHI